MQVKLRGSVSSQYLTALLMAAPLAQGPGSIDILISDELVSQPYVAMTVKMMAGFGVEVRSASPLLDSLKLRNLLVTLPDTVGLLRVEDLGFRLDCPLIDRMKR